MNAPPIPTTVIHRRLALTLMVLLLVLATMDTPATEQRVAVGHLFSFLVFSSHDMT